MKLGVLGDIHANHEALTAVLTHFEKNGVDKVIHVGDIVGYCSDFAEVIQTISELRIPGVIGNHEQMLLGTLHDARVTSEAKAAIRWTKSRISPSQASYLGSLPDEIVCDDYVVFHACPGDSTYRYSSAERAAAVFEGANARWPGWTMAFHGHMHRQQVFAAAGGAPRLVHKGEGTLDVKPGQQYLVCPGSVGISRDTKANTAFLIYETGAGLEFGRLQYEWKKRRAKDRKAGLHSRLYRPGRSILLQPLAILWRILGRLINPRDTT